MCGIIFAESFTGSPVNTAVIEQFQAQRHRGTQGFGAFDRINQRLIRATKERKMLGWLKNHPQASLMFHHRMPTSTANRKGACHPFSTRRHFETNYVLVHNGHIYNNKTLHDDHQKLGIEYSSWSQQEGKFNDSESLLWDVALMLEGRQDELKAYGNIAFICLAIPRDHRKSTKLYFARNTNPLHMQLTDDNILLSSEGEGEDIKPDTLYCYNYKTHAVTTEALEVPTHYPFQQSTYPYSSTSPRQSYAGGAWGDYDDEDDELALYGRTRRDDWLDSSEDDDPLPGEWPKAQFGPKTSSASSALRFLPDDEDYTWSAMYPGIKQEVVITNDDGSQLNVKQTIIERIENYLDTADGYYFDAQALLKYDLHTLRRQIVQDEEQGFVEDDDLLMEADLLQVSIETLAGCPEWVDSSSRSQFYANI